MPLNATEQGPMNVNKCPSQGHIRFRSYALAATILVLAAKLTHADSAGEEWGIIKGGSSKGCNINLLNLVNACQNSDSTPRSGRVVQKIDFPLNAPTSK